MKTIRFKAWDKKSKRFETYFHLDSYGIPAVFSKLTFQFEPSSDLILCQYSGLKDKNNVEIFENDIVKLDIWNPLYNQFNTHNSQIIFDHGMFMVEKWGCSLQDALEREDTKNGVEVIGNIFQNKDLLEDAKIL